MRLASKIALVLLAVSGAGDAWAQNGTMNLAWNVCRTAASNNTLANNDQMSACDDDLALAKRLVVTFKNTQTVPGFQGTTIVLDIQMAAFTLPAWWDFHACQGTENNLRVGQLANVSIPGLSSCTNPFAGDPVGTFGGYDIKYNIGGPARVRYEADWVRGTTTYNLVPPSSAGGYTAQVVALGFAGSADPGDGLFCEGCCIPACIVLSRVHYFGTGLVYSIDWPELRSLVTWQGGAGSCPGYSPVAARTWGQVKAMYR